MQRGAQAPLPAVDAWVAASWNLKMLYGSSHLQLVLCWASHLRVTAHDLHCWQGVKAYHGQQSTLIISAMLELM